MTEIEALLRDFERHLAEATQEREQAEARESAIRQTVEGLRRLSQLNGQPPAEPAEAAAPIVAEGAFVGMSIKAATVAYLRLVGVPQTNRQIVTALQRGGITSEAANFSKTVRAVLLRDFDNEETRVLTWNAPLWGLREWEVLPLPEGN